MPRYQYPCFCGKMSIIKDPVADMVNCLRCVLSPSCFLVNRSPILCKGYRAQTHTLNQDCPSQS